MKGKLLYIYIIIFFIFLFPINIAKAAVSDGFTSIYDYPKLLGTFSDAYSPTLTPVPAGYVNFISQSKDTDYVGTPTGTGTLGGAGGLYGNYWIFSADDINNPDKDSSVLITNAGFYGGYRFDVKITFSNMQNGGKSVNFFTPSPKAWPNPKSYFMAFELNGQAESSGGILSNPTDPTTVDITAEFYEHGTQNLVDFKGIWPHRSVDFYKYITFPSTTEAFEGLYAYKREDALTSNVYMGYKDSSDGNTTTLTGFDGNLTAEPSNSLNVFLLFNTVNGKYSWRASTKKRSSATFTYATNIISKVKAEFPPLYISGDTNDDSTVVSYTASQYVPTQTFTQDYATSYKSYISLDPLVDLSTATIVAYDNSGNDVTSSFTITEDTANNGCTIEISSANLKDTSFNGQQYTFEIVAKLNESIDQEPYYHKDDGYLHIPGNSYTVVDGVTSSKINTYAKTKFNGVITGDPVPQNVILGTSTADLNPSDLVTNLKSPFTNDVITIKGFKEEKTFSTLGSDSVVVLVESEQGFTGEITVPITVVDKPNLTATFKLFGVDAESKDSNDNYTEVYYFGSSSRTVLNYGDSVDVSGEPIAASGKQVMEYQHWDYTNQVQEVYGTTKKLTTDNDIISYSAGTDVNYLFVAQKGNILIHFVDVAGKSVHDDLTLENLRLPDGPVNLTTNTDVISALTEISDDGYAVVTPPDNETGVVLEKDNTVSVTYVLKKTTVILDPSDGETPFTPEDPDTKEEKVVNPAADSLRIQYISDFDFGSSKRNLFSSANFLGLGDYGLPENSTSKYVPGFVSIADDQKDSKGWDLSVSMPNSFTNNSSTLEGAYITLSDMKYNGPQSTKPSIPSDDLMITPSSTLVSSDTTGLKGSWSLSLGDLVTDDKSSGVQLTVPKNAARSLGKYQTTIVWTLVPKL